MKSPCCNKNMCEINQGEHTYYYCPGCKKFYELIEKGEIIYYENN